MFERGIAIVTLTKWGVTTSKRIAQSLEKAEIKHTIYTSESLRSDDATSFNETLSELFGKLFNAFDAIIAVMAMGIVVRSIAPLIANKTTDPAVVVVDDLGKYSISLLSGHFRGANRLAKIVAEEIGAIPVVTTATELLGKKSVEEIAEEHNLKIVNMESLTAVNSAIVNERRLLFATIGTACPEIGIGSAKSNLVSSIDQLQEIMQNYDAGIVIAQHALSLGVLTKSVTLLIPKTGKSEVE